MAELTFFREIVVVCIGAIAAGLVGVAIATFKHKSEDFTNLKKQVYSNKRCILLLKKALILKAQMTDEQIKHDHPSEFHEYEKVMKEILEDKEEINL